MGDFLLYRELGKPFPAGEKKRAKKRKRRNEDGDCIAKQGVYNGML
jgi:hypothetical protein